MNILFLESVLNAFDEPFYVIRIEDHAIVLANHAARREGINGSFTLPHTCHALTHNLKTPCEGAEHPCPMKQVIQSRQSCVVEHIHYKPDGRPYFAEVHGCPIHNKKGEIEYLVEYSMDVTGKKEAGERLNLFQRALEFSGNGVMITNIKGDIEYINPAFSRITGYSVGEVIGKNPRILKSGEHSRDFYSALRNAIQCGDVWRGEMTNRRKDGSLYWEHQTIAPVRDSRGQITHFIAIMEDITARKEVERELARLAFTDSLTGLANRRHFFHHAEAFFGKFFGKLSHPPIQLAALMVDIDHFKNINDQYGHITGDEALQEIAKRLKRNLRPNDLIARYGGEEFAVILPHADWKIAWQIAERLRLSVSREHISLAVDLSVTISVGIACLSKEMKTLDALLHAADDALYQAKHGGRNRCVIYHERDET